MSLDKEELKRMTDLLRSGATMTAEHCPACNSPLFRVGGQLRCPKCNKQVVIVKEGEEDKTLGGLTALNEVEQTLIVKLYECTQDLREEKNPARILELGTSLNVWLDALERVKRIQRILS